MRRALSILCVVALSACAGAGTGLRSIPNVPTSILNARNATGINWNVQVGGATDGFALQDLDFYPNKITIDAGDTITFHVAGGAGGDAHTVAFVPPGQPIPSPLDPNDLVPTGGTTVDGTKFINSGILVGGVAFRLLFTKPGTYPILCLFHEPAMEFSVVVQRTGVPYPHGAKYYRAIGNNQAQQDLEKARASVSEFPFQPGGTTVAVGIDPGRVQYPPDDSTVLRFLDNGNVDKLATSGNLTVKVGTIVTFVNQTSNEPHTITLPKAGVMHLPPIPPDPSVNAVPAPGVTKYDGAHVVNSGTILGGTKFRLMITKPGKYLYGCLYHGNSGMAGTITVTQ